MKTVKARNVLRVVNAARAILLSNPYQNASEFGRMCAQLNMAVIALEADLEQGEIVVDERDERATVIAYPTTKAAVPF